MSIDDRLELENLSKLVFYRDFFTYSGASHSYAEIEHINYTAVQTKHSINFVPTGTTYEADLKLELADDRMVIIGQERQFFGTQKPFFIAVARAAAIFSKMTFNQRIDNYLSAMKSKGYVEWGHYQIASDGDLFDKQELILNIHAKTHALRLAPFELILHKTKKSIGERLKASWTGKRTIPVSRDRDCFLYLMKYQFGITWQGEEVPQLRSGEGSAARASTVAQRDRYLHLLGLGGDASRDDIKSAFRQLARRYHPDVLKAGGATPAEVKSAEEFLKLLNHAYEWLTRHDPFTRNPKG